MLLSGITITHINAAYTPGAPTVPGAPTSATAAGGNTTATVSFVTPINNGGDPITGYTVTSSPTGGTDSNAGSTSLTHTITGLTNGTAYTFTVKATNAVGTGPASAASNSVTPSSSATVPGAPTTVIATAGNGSASITFAAPSSNGGSTITGYTVTSSPAGGTDSNAGSTSLTHSVTGLTNGNSYTFVVTATNAIGTGPASAASNAVVPSTVPGTPTGVTATAGNASATINFTAGSTGGLAVTYTATSTPGSLTGSATSTPITVTGLTNGTAYTFTVTAANADGNSSASAASNSVTPNAGTAGYDGVITVGTGANANKFVNGSGAVTQLRGAAVSGLETALVSSALQSTSNYWVNSGFTTPPWSVMASTWDMNCIRVPLNAAAWLGLTVTDSNGSTFPADHPGLYQSTVISLVSTLNSLGMYVLLDLHWTCPGTIAPECENVMMDSTNSANFWESVSNVFGYPNGTHANRSCIFEIFNEPYLDHAGNGYLGSNPNGDMYINGGSFNLVRASSNSNSSTTMISYNWTSASFQSVINAIRSTGATNIVVIGNNDYTADMSGFLTGGTTGTSVLTDTRPAGYSGTWTNQMACAWHAYYAAYSGSQTWAYPQNFNYANAILAAGYPVFVTELGETNGTTTPNANLICPWADSNSQSVIAWSFNPWGGAGLQLITNATGTTPDGAWGTFFYNWLIGHTSSPTVPGAPTGATATAGNATASVTFVAPTNTGGDPITGYTVISNPAGGTDSNAGSTSLTHSVTGLTNGTAYTFTVTATNAVGTGAASAASNSVTPGAPTVPGAPTGATATAGNASATVTFTAPSSTGGDPITGYTVISNPAGGTDSNAGSTSLTHSVTGLTNGVSYTFTVTATNAVGTGAASGASNSVTPALPTVPGAPTGATASAGNASATVTFVAPSNTGGDPITGYTVTSSPAGGTDSNAGSTILTHNITGLTNGTAYTFTVKATNAVGTGAASAASNSVTPVAGTAGYDGVIAINSAGKFVNGAGVVIQLRGTDAALLDSQITNHPTQPYGSYSGDGGPPWPTLGSPSTGLQTGLTPQGWNANAMRMTTNIAAWFQLTTYQVTGTATSPSWGTGTNQDASSVYKPTIAAAIQWARLNGMYIIIDVHWSSTQFTFGGVTHYTWSFDQPLFLSTATDLPFWTAAAGAGPAGWNGTQGGIVAWLQTNFGPGGPYHDSRFGGSTGINDIIFELFNEPYLSNQTLNYNTANLGAGTSISGPTMMKTGGWASGYCNQTVTGPSFSSSSLWGASGQTNTNGNSACFNWWWQVAGYQQCVDGIRALGATNVIQCNGEGFASSVSNIATWFPTDSLSPQQLSVGWHAYGGPYPSSLDASGAAVLGYTEAVIAGNNMPNGHAGLGRPVPVCCDETSGAGGTIGNPADPYQTSMTQWADGGTSTATGTSYTGNFGLLPWNFDQNGSSSYQMTYQGTSFTFVGSISAAVPTGYPVNSGVLTVTSTTATINPGLVIISGSTAHQPFVGPQLTGTVGGAGTYVISLGPQNFVNQGSTTFTGAYWLPIGGNGTAIQPWMRAHSP